MDVPRKEGKRRRYPSGKRTLRYLSVFATTAGLTLVGVGLTAGPANAAGPTASAVAVQQSDQSVTVTVTGSGYVPHGGSQLRLTDLPRVYGTGYVGCQADASGDINCPINTGSPYTNSTIRWEFDDLSGNLTAGPYTVAVQPYTPTTYATVTSHEQSSAAANDPSYWGSSCTKITPGGDSYVLPAGTYSEVIVKAGSGQYANTVFAAPPTAGQTVWADTNGDGTYNPGGPGGDKDISHVILCAGTPPPPPCVTLTTANVSQYGSLVWSGNSATVTLTSRSGGYCNDWTFDVTSYEPAAFPQTVKQVDAASVGKSGLSATATVDNTTCGQIDGYEGSGPAVGSTLSGPGKDYESNHKFLSQIFGGPNTWTIATSGCTTPTPKDASGDFTLTGVCGTGNDTVTPTAVNATAGQPVWNGTKVSVTFTADNGHLFPNGQSTLTVTKDEVDTSACPTKTTSPPPPPTSTTPAPPTSTTPAPPTTSTPPPVTTSPPVTPTKTVTPPPTHHKTTPPPPPTSTTSTTPAVPTTSPYTPGPGGTGDSLAKTGSPNKLLIELGIALMVGGLISLTTSSRRRGARQH